MKTFKEMSKEDFLKKCCNLGELLATVCHNEPMEIVISSSLTFATQMASSAINSEDDIEELLSVLKNQLLHLLKLKEAPNETQD